MRPTLRTAAALVVSVAASAQSSAFEQRGFLEVRGLGFPQLTDNDRAHGVGQGLLRWDGAYRATPWLRFNVSLDARADTHRQVDRDIAISFDDRRIQRPALNLRNWSAQVHKGIFTLEVGRQLIRWGRTDVVPITDRFTPRDYIASVVDTELLSVPAARMTLSNGADSLDLVWQGWFTPSRTPLLDQRWTVLPPAAEGFTIADGGARFPGGSQLGARWNRLAGRSEYSFSYFRGRANLPLFETLQTSDPSVIEARRFYPTIEMFGGDGAYQFPWLTLKGEAGYFKTTTPGAEEFVLYAIQAERQVRDVSLAGGYVGSAITNSPTGAPQFAPDRGFAESVVGRIAWIIDVNRSMSVDTAIRRQGSFTRFEYSQALGRHWRMTGGFVWLRGDPADFIGQYRRNSYFSFAIRYSF